ncbi:hypothetical protein [Burkholderia glumae]|uniref:hypothetical protein n=1 Tax=Burkholderia glumae TaxID=337 RepID=UPI002150C7D6|nr:hypothetical protein [Burkholderia glumae]
MTIALRLDADNIGPGSRHRARPGAPLTLRDVVALIARTVGPLSPPEREGFDDALALYLMTVLTGNGTPIIGNWDAAELLEYPEGMPCDDED